MSLVYATSIYQLSGRRKFPCPGDSHPSWNSEELVRTLYLSAETLLPDVCTQNGLDSANQNGDRGIVLGHHSRVPSGSSPRMIPKVIMMAIMPSIQPAGCWQSSHRKALEGTLSIQCDSDGGAGCHADWNPRSGSDWRIYITYDTRNDVPGVRRIWSQLTKFTAITRPV